MIFDGDFDGMKTIENDTAEIDKIPGDRNVDANEDIGAYLKEIKKIPLLSGEEEYELARAIHFWTQRAKLISHKIKKERDKREKRILHKTLRECERQAEIKTNKLVEHNLRLVVHMAKKYYGMPLMDMIQEGNMGLMRAAKDFDHRKGFKFSTYAVWWIRQAIMRAIDDKGKIIRIPVNRMELMRKYVRVKERLKRKNGQDPSREEIAKAIFVSEEEMHFLIESDKTPISLNMPVGEERIYEMQDFLEDAARFNPEQIAEGKQECKKIKRKINERMTCLSKKEKRVLSLRLQGKTLQETGGKLKLTRERVRQIQQEAISKTFAGKAEFEKEKELLRIAEELAEELV